MLSPDIITEIYKFQPDPIYLILNKEISFNINKLNYSPYFYTKYKKYVESLNKNIPPLNYIQSKNWLKKYLRAKIYPNWDIFDNIEISEDNIKSVMYEHKGLIKIPKELFLITDICELCLRNNNIKKLQPNISNLKLLINLYINENLLEEIPDEISKLKNLVGLSFSYNPLKKFPKSIYELFKLEMLLIDGIELYELHKEIGNLQNLRELYCRNNHIIKIPHELALCEKLEQIALISNNIEKLPRRIKKLRHMNLQFIYMGDNPMKTTPKYLKNLDNLILYN
jgi:Leucine-rich repeat (LRR) protein